MKLPLRKHILPNEALLITCSSHEARCKGIVEEVGRWHPVAAVVFHYDDNNPKREVNHKIIIERLKDMGASLEELVFTECSAVKSLYENMTRLTSILQLHSDAPIVLDISVFTKRHLLMMLRWLDDVGCWNRLTVVYTEPEDYDVSEFIPLSFGLKSMEQIPGFSACPDLSRPVHLVLFLGYEGDRALAAYEHVQPMSTTLAVTDPPYKPEWLGRTERLNRDLLSLVKSSCLIRVDGIDPESAAQALKRVWESESDTRNYAKIVCPVGTKPQTLGIYCYVRESLDPPAVIYASPLRHNHRFFSHGIGSSWVLKTP